MKYFFLLHNRELIRGYYFIIWTIKGTNKRLQIVHGQAKKLDNSTSAAVHNISVERTKYFKWNQMLEPMERFVRYITDQLLKYCWDASIFSDKTAASFAKFHEYVWVSGLYSFAGYEALSTRLRNSIYLFAKVYSEPAISTDRYKDTRDLLSEENKAPVKHTVTIVSKVKVHRLTLLAKLSKCQMIFVHVIHVLISLCKYPGSLHNERYNPLLEWPDRRWERSRRMNAKPSFVLESSSQHITLQKV